MLRERALREVQYLAVIAALTRTGAARENDARPEMHLVVAWPDSVETWTAEHWAYVVELVATLSSSPLSSYLDIAAGFPARLAPLRLTAATLCIRKVATRSPDLMLRAAAGLLDSAAEGDTLTRVGMNQITLTAFRRAVTTRFTRELLYLRAAVLASRATCETRSTAASWLCGRSPLWVFILATRGAY
ncbi:MAG: hypothetical protein WCN81_01945 [Actinomycetes bacterium]